MQHTIVVDPSQKATPRSITDALCERAVSDHVGYLEVFIGNQIVRANKRVCRLAGKIFTLPLNFEIGFGESLAGFLSVSDGSNML